MKRSIGNFLVVFSIICAVITFLWIRTILIQIPDNPSNRIRQQMFIGLLIAAVLLSSECAIFLYGRYLRHRYPAEIPKQVKTRRERCLLPLVISLGCSIAITILIFAPSKIFLDIKALFLIIGQGFVLAQLTLTSLSQITGINPGKGDMKQVILIAFILLYYVALFYPVFRIVTMDKKVEATRYKLMIMLLLTFVSIHILMGFVTAMLARA